MKMRHRVMLTYLASESEQSSRQASTEIPEKLKSKEDKSKQTRAVEELVKDVIKKHLPGYKNKVFSVGGHVRDKLMGRAPKDLDLVVDDPELELRSAEIFAKKFADAANISTANNPHPLNEQYGIWGVVLFKPESSAEDRKFIYNDIDLSGYVIEITPPREEGPYDFSDRKPSYVKYTSRKEDAKRRDLTINALYMNMATGDIEDYVGGQKDLQEKTLRPPDHPDGIEAIYSDDPLRIFRLIRFKGRYNNFRVDQKTEAAIKKFIKSGKGKELLSTKLSGERIRDELKEILTHPDAETAAESLERIKDFGLLDLISPSLSKLIDLYHDKVHHKGESVWEHTIEVLSKTPPSLKARLSALFHDIGKLETASKKTDSQGRDRIHFIDHEKAGVQLAESALRELKFPKDVITSIKKMIHSHMGLKRIDSMKSSKQLRFMRIFIEKLNDDLEDAISLIEADAKDDSERKKIKELGERIRLLREEDRKSGFLTERDNRAEYSYPVSGSEIKSKFKQKGEAIGALKARLKRMKLEGKLKDSGSRSVRDEVDRILRDLTRSEAAMSRVIKEYRNDENEFYSVK